MLRDLQLQESQIGQKVVRIIPDLLAEVFLEDAGVLGVVASDAIDELVADGRRTRLLSYGALVHASVDLHLV